LLSKDDNNFSCESINVFFSSKRSFRCNLSYINEIGRKRKKKKKKKKEEEEEGEEEEKEEVENKTKKYTVIDRNYCVLSREYHEVK
jgi:hypothetical protein